MRIRIVFPSSPNSIHYRPALDLIASGFWIGAWLGLSIAVQVHRTRPEFVRPGSQTFERDRPVRHAVAHRPFLRLAGLGIEAPDVLGHHPCRQIRAPILRRRRKYARLP